MTPAVISRAVIAALLLSEAATAQSIFPLNELVTQELIVDRVDPLECEQLQPNILGLQESKAIREGSAPDGIVINAHVYAFRRTISRADAAGDGPVVQDVVFVFQSGNASNTAAIAVLLAQLNLSGSDFAETIVCPSEDPPNMDVIWEEFAEHGPKGLSVTLNQPVILSVERRLEAALAETTDGPDLSASVGADSKAQATDPVDQQIYPWAARADLKSLLPGERAFAVEQVECSGDGNFIIASMGNAMKPFEGDPTGTDTKEATIIREEFIAANIYRGASGDANDRESVEASLDPEHYWCVPKKEICYQPIRFNEFGLKLRKGRSGTMPYENVYNLRLGIVTTLQRVVVDHCP